MKISIITPSLNQGDFIERTIESVLGQVGDFELEYLVVDGGSTDGTVDILRRYGDRLQWTSETDEGQSDAINKGFHAATGDVLAWLNSDDTYAPGALARVADVYGKTRFSWCFGNCGIVDEQDQPVKDIVTRYKVRQSRRYSFPRLLRRDFISQPSTFFARAAFEATGDIDRALYYSMDYDYWLRLGRTSAPVYVDAWLANFRWHATSKNGAEYRKAAWETFQTARRHARGAEALNLPAHFLHVLALSALYAFI